MLANGIIAVQIFAVMVFFIMTYYKQRLFGDKENPAKRETYQLVHIKKHPFLFSLEVLAVIAFIVKFFYDQQLLDLGYSRHALALSSSIFILSYSGINFLRAAMIYFEKSSK